MKFSNIISVSWGDHLTFGEGDGQWDERSDEEAKLLSQATVKGLVFSSFRFDNPEAIARGDWRA